MAASPLGVGPLTIVAVGYVAGNLQSYAGLTVKSTAGNPGFPVSQLFYTGANQLGEATDTIGGTYVNNDTTTATINGTAVTYTVVTGSTSNSAIAAGLAAAINANATTGLIVKATANGNVVTVQSKLAGTAGAYTFTVSKSSTSGTATASSATLVLPTAAAYQSFAQDLVLATTAARFAGDQNLQAGGGLTIDPTVDSVINDYVALNG